MGDAEHALGKYRLIAEIGRGGMADVYLAVVQGPAGFNKLVVIKKTRRELAQDQDFLTMFLDEARLAARLNHPNVVQTTEVGQDGDRYFIAMEYLDGQPLNRIRSRAPEIPLPLQVRVLVDALAGLHHAHELCDFDGTPLSVVHRDVTPQNVFVTYDGLIKLVDFGIAKAIDSSSETATGVVKGKVTYMAPEQARGERVDRRADLFAVGVMLWEAIAGRRMWKGVPDLKVLHELLGGNIPSIRQAAPSVPKSLAAICDKALAGKADDRYATAQDMHDALLHWLEEEGGKGTSARDVGRFVADKFGDDRAKVKAIIENQLRDVRWTGTHPRSTAMDLPKIDPGPLMITPTGGVESPKRSGNSSVTNATAAIPATTTQQSPTRPVRPTALIAIAACAMAVVVVVGVRFLAPTAAAPAVQPDTSSRSAPASSQGAAAPTVIQVVQPPPATADTVKLTIKVSPPNARIFLDDALLSAGPFEGKVVRTDQPKRVRVEAPHHVTKEETISLTGDAMMSFALEREAPGAPPAPLTHGKPPPTAEPVATQPPTPPPPAPLPPGQKPKRAIDQENPY